VVSRVVDAAAVPARKQQLLRDSSGRGGVTGSVDDAVGFSGLVF